METASESILLPGKTTGKLTIYPLVQIRLIGGASGGFIQVVPLAVIVDSGGGIQVFIIKPLMKSHRQSAG
ncbi:MAG TPA: hypothetical protein DG577_02090 [Firmicutes bacterium]|nr:hypothetical protein [Bacillota bacterium]HCX78180.1 hypothetical protein [Bacillota bacterium]